MKNHPGHFWICFWLFMIFMNTLGASTDKDTHRAADTLDRIEAKLGRVAP